MHFVTDFVQQSIPAGWQNRNGWHSGNCPLCRLRGHPKGDGRKRGGIHIHPTGFVYNCFNCRFKLVWNDGDQISNRLKFMLRGFGVNRDSIKRLQLEMLRENQRNEFFKIEPVKEAPYVIEWPEMELPDRTYSLKELPVEKIKDQELFADVLKMLIKRKLDFYADWHYSMCVGYRNRIILPFRYNGTIVGYTARDATGRHPQKYLSKQPTDFVFNLDSQDASREIVIAFEGPFDALCVDGIAFCGNEVNKNQVKIVNQLKKRVIVVPDSGDNKGNLTVRALQESWEVSFPDWGPGIKDANEAVEKFGRYFVLQSIIANATSNPTKIKLLEKTW